MGIVIIFLATSMPLFSQNYQAQANTLIAQAAALGPPAGLKYLISTNWQYGARGCAVKLSKTNPTAAANILIAIAQRLIIYANTTREQRRIENPRDPIQPFRYKYWQEAIYQLSLADRYIRIVSKTNPQLAANMAFQIAGIYYNNIPQNPNYKAYRRNYRAQARTHLQSSNTVSALTYAKKIKNKAQRLAMINRIKTQHKIWKL